MFNPSRDEVRQFFCQAWCKHEEQAVCTPQEDIACQIIAWHPEYHALLRDVEAAKARDWTPEDGGMNPFLHLSLHLAVYEQLSIDQPPGIVALYQQALQGAQGDAHAVVHGFLDALGELMWRAQQEGSMPDGQVYLSLIAQKINANQK